MGLGKPLLYTVIMNGAPIRRKMSDTHAGTAESKCEVDFGARSSDMKLGKFLKESGFPSLSKALDQVDKIQKKGQHG